MSRVLWAGGVALIVVSLACDGGGASSTPTDPVCSEGGITASAIVRPINSSCKTMNELLVRVSNQSCSGVTVDSAVVRALEAGNSCGDLPGTFDYEVGATIMAKTIETLEVGTIVWCCSCRRSFDCSWKIGMELDTDRGTFRADESKVFSKSLGKFCDRCSETNNSLQDGVVLGDDVVVGICGGAGRPVL